MASTPQTPSVPLPTTTATATSPSVFHCDQVKYYILLALVAMCFNVMAYKRYRNVGTIVSQSLSILCCAALLNWACPTSPMFVWLVVGCQVFSLFIALLNALTGNLKDDDDDNKKKDSFAFYH